jgi:hypothetical protein
MVSSDERARAIEEIRRIILSYPELSDRGDLDGMGSFLGGVRRGRPETPAEELTVRSAGEAAALYRDNVIYYPDGTSHARHLITNVDVDLADDGESATARSTYLVLQATDGFPLQPICAGGYGDTFVRDAGVWKMTIRTEWMNLKGDLSRHARTPERFEAGG